MSPRSVSASIRSKTMNPGTRRAIAYIAGRACASAEAENQQRERDFGADETEGWTSAVAADPEGILDLETGEHVTFEGRVDEEVAVYDHARNCLIGGPPSELHDGGTQAWINLRLWGNSFTGFDHESNHPFGGHVAGREVHLFDCEAERGFTYVVSGPSAQDAEKGRESK